jgi:hypothetical protein
MLYWVVTSRPTSQSHSATAPPKLPTPSTPNPQSKSLSPLFPACISNPFNPFQTPISDDPLTPVKSTSSRFRQDRGGVHPKTVQIRIRVHARHRHVQPALRQNERPGASHGESWTEMGHATGQRKKLSLAARRRSPSAPRSRISCALSRRAVRGRMQSACRADRGTESRSLPKVWDTC